MDSGRKLINPHGRAGGKGCVWILILIALAAAFIIWRFYFREPPQRPDMAGMMPPVRAAIAAREDMPQFLNGLGTVAPSGDVLVRSRVDGQLLKLHFNEGQRVAAGDLLAEIDPRPFRAALEQAQGNLEKDKAQLENAKNDLNRYARLAKGDFIADQQYETQKALVRQYQGIVEADQAAVDSARLQLEYSRVTAPISGRLGLRAVDEGNQIKASDANGIVRITETEPCDVIFTLPENQIGLVGQAMRDREKDPSLPPLEVQAWDREDKHLLATGRLVSLDNQIDAATGTVRLKARFDNDNHALFPNQFVNARLLARTIKNAVTIPAAAAQLGSKGSYCYVIEKEKQGGNDVTVARYREITPGIVANGRQIVEKGLEPGEMVVVDGVDRLRDGIRIRVAAIMDAETGENTAAVPPAKARDSGDTEAGRPRKPR